MPLPFTQLRADLDRLGLTRGLALLVLPVLPVPLGFLEFARQLCRQFVPPPPQTSFPQPSQPYSQQYPLGVIPPFRTPSPTGPPVFPSPPSHDGGTPFIPSNLGPGREGMVLPPLEEYRPPIPGGRVDNEIYIPPEPSYLSSSIESPRSSLAPVIVPPPQQLGQQQPPPPIFMHPASQPSPSQQGRTTSPPHSESQTPPPISGQPTIIVPLQPGAIPPAVAYPPSTHRVFDERPDQPILFLPPGQPFQVVASPCPGSQYDGP